MSRAIASGGRRPARLRLCGDGCRPRRPPARARHRLLERLRHLERRPTRARARAPTPRGIRSLVLDASLAPQGNIYLELLPHARRAFDAFFGSCAADPLRCSPSGPGRTLRGARGAAPRRSPRGDRARWRQRRTEDGRHRRCRGAGSAARSALRLEPDSPHPHDHRPARRRRRLRHRRERGPRGHRPPPDQWSLGQNLSDNCREEVAFFSPGALRHQARRIPDLAPLLETGHSAFKRPFPRELT
jgi:hypothetical protein